MSGLFEALGEPRRRAILELLASGERSAGDVVDEMQAQGQTSQPSISQHLKVLREAGLVSMRVDGTRRLYSIEVSGVATAQAWLAKLYDPLATFEQPLDALDTEISRGKHQGARGTPRRRPNSTKRSA